MFGLDVNRFTVLRREYGTDAEGDPSDVSIEVGSFTGTWGNPSSRDMSLGDRRGEQIDAVMSTASYAQLRLGDCITGLPNGIYEVVAIKPLPQVNWGRVFLRQTS